MFLLIANPVPSVAKKVVAERFGPNAITRQDMLNSFIRHGLSQEEAESEALLQIIAGSDTSATTIRMTMLNLLANPNAYRKLQAEIDEAIAKGQISSPIKDSEARTLPYLQGVIKEGLRIVPPAGGAFYKTVPPEGDVIHGIFVPGGTEIGSSALGIHHSTKTFGPDAEFFRPERWIEAAEKGEEEFARLSSSVDLVFHSGKYRCLGQTVALMEFNKIFVEVCCFWKTSLVDDCQVLRDILTCHDDCSCSEDLILRLSRRWSHSRSATR